MGQAFIPFIELFRGGVGKVRKGSFYPYSLLTLFSRKSLIWAGKECKIGTVNWEKVHSASGMISNTFPRKVNLRSGRYDLYISFLGRSGGNFVVTRVGGTKNGFGACRAFHV